LNKKYKNTENCQFLKNSWQYRKILQISADFLQIERCFYDSKNGFRQKVWGLGIFPYRFLAVLKISRKSGADSVHTPLVS